MIKKLCTNNQLRMLKVLKINEIIDLNKKINFLFLLMATVFILTYINNYLFYEYVKIRDYQEIKILSKTIQHKIKNCNEQKHCIDDINGYMDEIKPFVELLITDNSAQSIVKYSNIKERHKDRLPVQLTNNLEKDSNRFQVIILKNSTPNIFYATFRSITFSIKDIISKINDEGIETTVNWYFKQKIYLRSQHVIFFFLFAYLLLKMLSIKQQQLNRKVNKQNLNIVNLVKNVESAKESERELKDLIDDLKSKDINILNKLKRYDSIINPPIDLLKYEDIVNLDPESIIFKCRKVTEKIVTKLYIQHIGNSAFKSLDSIIKELRNKKVLNKKALSYANTIKAFGNISAHPDIEKPFEFTNEDAKVISNALILLIEELNLK